MRRFFVEPGLLQGTSGIIGGELRRHLATVLRLKVGDTVRLADGTGREAIATITALEKEGIRVDLEPAAVDAAWGDGPQITLYQGLPKGEKLELILQKCTELGAAAVVPFMAERSVTRLEGGKREQRVARWRKISLEAARQSGRGTVPRVDFLPGLTGVLEEDHDLRIMLWEEETGLGLRDLLETTPRPGSIAVIVGPEGGLTADEAARAAAAGYRPVSLGRRIMRTETAGLAVVSILQYLWGDLG